MANNGAPKTNGVQTEVPRIVPALRHEGAVDEALEAEAARAKAAEARTEAADTKAEAADIEAEAVETKAKPPGQKPKQQRQKHHNPRFLSNSEDCCIPKDTPCVYSRRPLRIRGLLKIYPSERTSVTTVSPLEHSTFESFPDLLSSHNVTIAKNVPSTIS